MQQRRRISQRSGLLLPIILALFLVSGCATSQMNKAVTAYELAGITLKAAYDTAKPSCDSGALTAERCAQVKKIYNEARSSYILAGDALLIAVDVSDMVKRQAKLEEYQTLTNQVTKLTTQILKLLQEWKVIK